MTNSKQSVERREHERVPALLTVFYGDGVEPMNRATSADISPGGLFVKTDHPLDTGKKILLYIYLTDTEKPVMADCEVAWCQKDHPIKPNGMGLRFHKISWRDVERLNDFWRMSF